MIRKFILFVLLLSGLAGMAQDTLGISRIGFAPAQDTVAGGSVDSFNIWVINHGPLLFNDYLRLETGIRDTAAPSIIDTTDYYNSVFPVVIPIGDSVQVTLTNHYNIGPYAYRYGIDVIVIWPLGSGITAKDSLEFNVFITDVSHVTEIDISKLHLYPNPTADLLTVDAPVESITLYDNHGRIVAFIRNERSIHLEGLAAGIYHADVVLVNKMHYQAKILKK